MADTISHEMRCYCCILCKKAVITEGRTETSPHFENPSDAPDQSNCSFGSTSNYIITGGKLLKRRIQNRYGELKDGAWIDCSRIRSQIKSSDIITLSELHKHYGEIPLGGVCTACLKNKDKEHAQMIELLEFESE